MSATANASSSSDELDSDVFAGRVLPGGTLVGILISGARLEEMRCFGWLSDAFSSVVLVLVEGDVGGEAGGGAATGTLLMDRGAIRVAVWAANLGTANGFGAFAETLGTLTANGFRTPAFAGSCGRWVR